jgi:hypothetical protein
LVESPTAKIEAPAPVAEVTAHDVQQSEERAAPVAAEHAQVPEIEVRMPSLTLPPDSDLVLVETRAATVSTEEDEPAVPRARRVRPPRVTIPDEPLQLVETHKQDAG